MNEITPQTNYVFLFSDGLCAFDPRFDHSATHCDIDVTWFPFDIQTCFVALVSWILDATELNVTIHSDAFLVEYIASDEWSVECTLSSLLF